MTFVPGREVEVHGLKLFLDMSVGIGGDKWPAADLVSFSVKIKTSSMKKLCNARSILTFIYLWNGLVLSVHHGRSLEAVFCEDILREEDNRTRCDHFFTIIICLNTGKHALIIKWNCSFLDYFRLLCRVETFRVDMNNRQLRITLQFLLLLRSKQQFDLSSQ